MTTGKPEANDWSAVWSIRNKCGLHAKGWCVKHHQCCKKNLKTTRGSCWTDPENVPLNEQEKVKHLRTLQPHKVKFVLAIGSA
ncbi:MAG: hypothetical protein A2359_04905 [Candidatus Moranbacteria bacterium RIFOXYB1_FULL_43_19]|nr:MAG: hypothetical protein A2359_04905 [Candidatus Moranbacteria bacterium RIFOXYB1_FULL_43_19]OGI28348.1 MAG: hypothetical protein A2184_04200 [Candidatus Moranbacteria bacterium RIFOXYA1_FULL_44_7]OGI33592.1 MAG: hypothetical protein A2420_00535 [Candidatus Moranbacteria bacterium RIFOXYC1_FULL_44_13]OGI37136.1 MAG: hypothetical protein A2612_00065 [Candidatus Moranbacteria bacterium RIFOXYD1_FULL_44_12]